MALPETNHYEVLGVPKTATQEEIKKAYRKLLPKVHPDTGGTSAIFRITQMAYETLGDPAARTKYDNELINAFGRNQPSEANPPATPKYSPPYQETPRPRTTQPQKTEAQKAAEREIWRKAAQQNNGANVRPDAGGTRNGSTFPATPTTPNVELKQEYWTLVKAGVPLKKVLGYRRTDRIVTSIWLALILVVNFVLFQVTLTGPSNDSLINRIFLYTLFLVTGNGLLFGLSVLSGVIIRAIRRRRFRANLKQVT